MRRPSAVLAVLALLLGAGACQSSDMRRSGPAGTGDEGGSGGNGGGTGAGGATGGKGGSGAGGRADAGPIGGAGGSAGSLGSGGAGGEPADAAVTTGPDAPAERPAGSSDGGAGDGYPDSDFLTGRPDIRLCKKEWTKEQCCAFLCSCLNTLCTDSAKAKPGLANCMSWCPGIGISAVRCHVYHCYVSVSPTGGIRDHDSHCGHAANQVAGGGCPAEVP